MVANITLLGEELRRSAEEAVFAKQMFEAERASRKALAVELHTLANVTPAERDEVRKAILNEASIAIEEKLIQAISQKRDVFARMEDWKKDWETRWCKRKEALMRQRSHYLERIVHIIRRSSTAILEMYNSSAAGEEPLGKNVHLGDDQPQPPFFTNDVGATQHPYTPGFLNTAHPPDLTSHGLGISPQHSPHNNSPGSIPPYGHMSTTPLSADLQCTSLRPGHLPHGSQTPPSPYHSMEGAMGEQALRGARIPLDSAGEPIVRQGGGGGGKPRSTDGCTSASYDSEVGDVTSNAFSMELRIRQGGGNAGSSGNAVGQEGRLVPLNGVSHEQGGVHNVHNGRTLNTSNGNSDSTPAASSQNQKASSTASCPASTGTSTALTVLNNPGKVATNPMMQFEIALREDHAGISDIVGKYAVKHSVSARRALRTVPTQSRGRVSLEDCGFASGLALVPHGTPLGKQSADSALCIDGGGGAAAAVRPGSAAVWPGRLRTAHLKKRAPSASMRTEGCLTAVALDALLAPPHAHLQTQVQLPAKGVSSPRHDAGGLPLMLTNGRDERAWNELCGEPGRQFVTSYIGLSTRPLQGVREK